MKKKNTVLKIGLGVVAAALAAANYACDYAIKRPDPAKKKNPETRETYIKRDEIRRQNNQRLYDLDPEDLTIKSVTGLNMKAWFLPAEKPTNRFVICVPGSAAVRPFSKAHVHEFLSLLTNGSFSATIAI